MNEEEAWEAAKEYKEEIDKLKAENKALKHTLELVGNVVFLKGEQ